MHWATFRESKQGYDQRPPVNLTKMLALPSIGDQGDRPGGIQPRIGVRNFNKQAQSCDQYQDGPLIHIGPAAYSDMVRIDPSDSRKLHFL